VKTAADSVLRNTTMDENLEELHAALITVQNAWRTLTALLAWAKAGTEGAVLTDIVRGTRLQ